MPKETITPSTVRIREVDQFHNSGFGQSGMVTKARVIEIAADLVPEGALIVGDDTPVSDWQEIEN